MCKLFSDHQLRTTVCGSTSVGLGILVSLLARYPDSQLYCADGSHRPIPVVRRGGGGAVQPLLPTNCNTHPTNTNLTPSPVVESLTMAIVAK